MTRPLHVNLHVARQIGVKRREKGIPVASICEVLGIAPSQYSRVENGYIPITLSRLWSIAELLDCNPRDLLPEEGK
jgi:transcriptional regulator with XRE-family HTH domain